MISLLEVKKNQTETQQFFVSTKIIDWSVLGRPPVRPSQSNPLIGQPIPGPARFRKAPVHLFILQLRKLFLDFRNVLIEIREDGCEKAANPFFFASVDHPARKSW